jgi:hypothetical protein
VRLRRVTRVLVKYGVPVVAVAPLMAGQQGEVTAGVVHLAAAEGDGMTVMIEPERV